MEDVKKTDEAAKPEELAERVELTDEQLDQASGGMQKMEEILMAVHIKTATRLEPYA